MFGKGLLPWRPWLFDHVFTQVAKSTHYQPRFGGENVFLEILDLA
jgi:hypothetical protein